MSAIHRCMPESDKRYHLDFFAVLRTHREKDFGSRLMEELLRVARGEDKVLSLTCRKWWVVSFERVQGVRHIDDRS